MKLIYASLTYVLFSCHEQLHLQEAQPFSLLLQVQPTALEKGTSQEKWRNEDAWNPLLILVLSF